MLEAKGVEVARVNARDLESVLEELKKRELQSVLVEGGTAIAGAFIESKLVDKISLMVVPIIIGGNVAPNAIGGSGVNSLDEALKLKNIEIVKHGEDFEITGYPTV